MALQTVVQKAGSSGPVRVTYTPLDEGDPVVVTWNGIKFQANVPIELSPSQTVLQTIILKDEDPDGIIRSKPVDKKVSMIELAKLNPHFRVEGFTQAKRTDPSSPRTPEEYKAYAVRWINTSTQHNEMDRRWTAERGMREALGCGEDLLEEISSLFERKYTTLMRMSR